MVQDHLPNSDCYPPEFVVTYLVILSLSLHHMLRLAQCLFLLGKFGAGDKSWSWSPLGLLKKYNTAFCL